jgi:hypothetical protein
MGDNLGCMGGINDEYSNLKALHLTAEAHRPASYVHSHQSVRQNAARCKRSFSHFGFDVQILAEVSLSSALLLRCECRSGLCQVGVCGLDQSLDGGDDASSGLALEGLGFEGLHDEGEHRGGLGEDSLVLSIVMLDRQFMQRIRKGTYCSINCARKA